MNMRSGFLRLCLAGILILEIAGVMTGCGRIQKTPEPVISTDISADNIDNIVQPSLTSTKPSSTSTIIPVKTDAPKTYWKDFIIGDFTAVHSPNKGSDNEFLIFGNIPISKPPADLSRDLVRFIGRWEGYDFSPPVKKDYKAVLVIQEINNDGGIAYLWYGSILQYPSQVKKIFFKVVAGDPPSLESEVDLGPGADGLNRRGTIKLVYDPETSLIRAGILGPENPTGAMPVEFTRSQTFFVYRDYEKYFASKQIYAKPYNNSELKKFGWGYLIYLPDGYEKQTDQSWPLIFFLCGSGERGTNPLILAKHGPWNFILNKGPLPFIIAAPMLIYTNDYRSFPEEYMSGALDELVSDYRINNKQIYLTGLSMGGEASYRFALYRPDVFAAVAPFAAFDAKFMPVSQRENFKPSLLPYDRVKGLPFWVFHGTDDPFVPLYTAQKTVDALIQAGADVRFTILPGYDHDSWSEAYLDPAFYQWLLGHHK